VTGNILVDHARSKMSAKRGAGAVKVPLEEVDLLSPDDPTRIVELDEALSRLAELDERQARAVELHYFAGLSYEETAKALEISTSTVHRELKLAKAWLYQQLQGPPSDDSNSPA